MQHWPCSSNIFNYSFALVLHSYSDSLSVITLAKSLFRQGFQNKPAAGGVPPAAGLFWNPCLNTKISIHNYPICVRLVYCVTCTDILATITSKGIFLLYTTCMIRYLKNMYRAFDSTVCSLISTCFNDYICGMQSNESIGLFMAQCASDLHEPACMWPEFTDCSFCRHVLQKFAFTLTPPNTAACFTWFVYTQSDKLCFWTRVDIECAHAIKLFSHNSSKDTDSGCLL